MRVDKNMAKELYKSCAFPCSDICKNAMYNEYNEENRNDSLCSLCCENNQQFFIPSFEFIKKINEILEGK